VTALHVVLPNDIDDVSAPSGGNGYDRRLCRGLAALGWSVHEHAVHGGWPEPSAADLAALAGVLARLPDGATVLVDGLVASAAAGVLVGQAGRLGLFVLVHMPLGDTDPAARAAERAVLHAAAGVIATSDWTRHRLMALYGLPAGRVHVATPGVDEAPPAPGSGTGTALVCVAVVSRHKGHDLLVDALAALADLPWSCVCVGSVDRYPGFVRELSGRINAYGLDGRVQLTGPRIGAALDAAYAAADLFVLPSRGETYGMVVAEALARGIPVLASAVKGLPDAVGRAPDGSLPGLLVPPEDPAGLAAALRQWLGDGGLRDRLRGSALGRRGTLTGWHVTARQVSDILLVWAVRN
jgi:glycosyltransferase involved in cell wall biosynthesis